MPLWYIKCDNHVKLSQTVSIRTTFCTNYFWNKSRYCVYLLFPLHYYCSFFFTHPVLIKEWMERHWTSDVNIGNGNILKYPVGTFNFCSKFVVNKFCVTVADDDIWSLTYTFLYKYLCWWNLNKFVWFKPQEIFSFLIKKKKNGKPFLPKRQHYFWKSFCMCWNIN